MDSNFIKRTTKTLKGNQIPDASQTSLDVSVDDQHSNPVRPAENRDKNESHVSNLT